MNTFLRSTFLLHPTLRVFFICLMTLLTSPCSAQTRLSVQGAGQLYPIALPQLCIKDRRGDSNANAHTNIPETISRDLTLSGYFSIINPNSFVETPGKCTGPNDFAYSDWSVIGVDGLVRGVVDKTEDGELLIQMYLHDVQLKKVVLGKEYRGDESQITKIAHRFANEIMRFFTGEPGIFGTKIVYSGRVGRFKELFMMDMDGTNVRQLTNDRGLSLFPGWGPFGKRVTYTGYRLRQPDVFLMDLENKRVSRVTNTPQLDVAPRLTKDGRSLIMSRSSGRNSDIILTDLKGNLLRRLTRPNGSIDVSADLSPDGKSVVFVSNRGGTPQVYTMNSNGGNVRRVSFAQSNYCTSPSWSPKGNRIAFICRADRGYHLFTAMPDGRDAFQLTSYGSNEDPSWSPDGNYIVFSTTANRSGVKKLAVVKADGSNLQILTGDRTEETDPVWGPRTY